MNLMIYSFLTSKGSSGFDLHATVKGLSGLLNDKSNYFNIHTKAYNRFES